MLTMALEHAGVHVVTAVNGVEALHLARTHHPSLILLDLMMPRMTGEAFRKFQLATAEIREIPVVVVSAHHDAAKIAQRMRASGCLLKPIDFDQLGALVARYCRHA